MNKETAIVRQSQIKVTMELLKEHGIVPTLLEATVMTECLADYILKGFDSSVIKRIKEVDKWIESKSQNGTKTVQGN
jgi:hypothetical protein